MEEEDINSLRDLMKSLDEDIEKLKDSMKSLNGEEFNRLKEESNGILKKIEEVLK